MDARLNDHYSVAAPALSLLHGTDRTTEIAVFGALVSLLIVHGIAPTPMCPLFILWVMHRCDFSCITQGLLTEWYPNFALTVQDLNDLGPGGNLDRFQALLDTYANETVSYFASPQDVYSAYPSSLLACTAPGS